MIPRTHRFHGQKGLRYVYQKGATTRGPNFSIKAVLNSRRQTYRAAVVVSRKVHKSAVGRNRIRRRLYAIIRQLGDKIHQPYDIILTVYNNTLLDMPAKELADQVEQQLAAAGVLKRT